MTPKDPVTAPLGLRGKDKTVLRLKDGADGYDRPKIPKPAYFGNARYRLLCARSRRSLILAGTCDAPI